MSADRPHVCGCAPEVFAGRVGGCGHAASSHEGASRRPCTEASYREGGDGAEKRLVASAEGPGDGTAAACGSEAAREPIRDSEHDVLGRIHSVETFGTVDGPGVRFVVFLQGCPLRCAYCHNPDTWNVRAGEGVRASELMGRFERTAAFYRSGGITASGGEPLMQPEFTGALFKAAHARAAGRVHTCLDTSGFGYDARRPDRFEPLLSECDLVLLDIKHADAQEHRALTGADMAPVLAFGDELARRGIAAVVRHVVVPGITDTREECERLGELIAPWRNIVGLELLPYHAMGADKYARLGMEYALADTPPFDPAGIAGLRDATLRAMRRARARS